MDRWISVKEDLPKEAGPILVRAGEFVYPDSFVYSLDKGFSGYDNITHWRELPRAHEGCQCAKLEVTEPLNGVEFIRAERERQIYKEVFTPQHDSMHNLEELATAAACYAVHGNEHKIAVLQNHGTIEPAYRDAWPWGKRFDKREKHERLKRLAIAGALIAAEIDRELEIS